MECVVFLVLSYYNRTTADLQSELPIFCMDLLTCHSVLTHPILILLVIHGTHRYVVELSRSMLLQYISPTLRANLIISSYYFTIHSLLQSEPNCSESPLCLKSTTEWLVWAYEGLLLGTFVEVYKLRAESLLETRASPRSKWSFIYSACTFPLL